MNRRVLVSVLLALAIALPLFFLEYRFQPLRCQVDVCDEGVGHIWTVVEDTTYPPGSLGPDHPTGTIGVFPRRGIPVAIGAIGGLLAPVLLIGGATIVALKRKR